MPRLSSISFTASPSDSSKRACGSAGERPSTSAIRASRYFSVLGWMWQRFAVVAMVATRAQVGAGLQLRGAAAGVVSGERPEHLAHERLGLGGVGSIEQEAQRAELGLADQPAALAGEAQGGLGLAQGGGEVTSRRAQPGDAIAEHRAYGRLGIAVERQHHRVAALAHQRPRAQPQLARALEHRDRPLPF